MSRILQVKRAIRLEVRGGVFFLSAVVAAARSSMQFPNFKSSSPLYTGCAGCQWQCLEESL